MLTPKQARSECEPHSRKSARGKPRAGHTVLLRVPRIMVCAALFGCGEDLTSPTGVAPPLKPIPFTPIPVTPPPVSLRAVAEDRDAPYRPDSTRRSAHLVAGTSSAPVR
jgi:hypothetical protein